MPEPIQSSSGTNHCYYDPADEVSRAPEASSAPPAPSATPLSSAAITPPLSPAPSATDGKDVLLEQYGSVTENCNKHLIGAGVSLGIATASVAVGLLSTPTGIGPVTGVLTAVGGIVRGAADLASYFSCEEKNEWLLDTQARCERQGGALMPGAGSSALCIIPRE